MTPDIEAEWADAFGKEFDAVMVMFELAKAREDPTITRAQFVELLNLRHMVSPAEFLRVLGERRSQWSPKATDSVAFRK